MIVPSKGARWLKSPKVEAMFRRYMLLSLLAASLGTGLLYSQSTVTILGKVPDCTGAVIPGAMLQAKNTSTSAQKLECDK
jgi:hypothetical protein